MSSAVRTIQIAELLFPALVDAHAVLVREAGLELLRRLVEHVREHEAAGRGERRGGRRRERAPGQAHPGAAVEQRRRVVGIARRRLGARRAPASRPPRRRPTPATVVLPARSGIGAAGGAGAAGLARVRRAARPARRLAPARSVAAAFRYSFRQPCLLSHHLERFERRLPDLHAAVLLAEGRHRGLAATRP